MKATIDDRKRLHHLCFKDNDAYVDGFFNRIYNGNNSVDFYENGTLIATLYYKRYAYALHGRNLPYSFVSGLCVHPEHRSKGLATILIQQFLSETSDALVVLHPFNVDFYLKQGFVGASYAKKIVSDGQFSSMFSLRSVEVRKQTAILARLNQNNILTQHIAQRIWLSNQDIKNQIALEQEDGAQLQFIYLDEIPLGYCLRSQSEVFYYDLLPDKWIPQGLSYYRPFVGDIYNMVRAANVGKLLRAAFYKPDNQGQKIKFSFNLTDSRVPENEGGYQVVIEKGVCIGVIRTSPKRNYPHISTEQLTYLATGQSEKVPEVDPSVRDRFMSFYIFDLLQY